MVAAEYSGDPLSTKQDLSIEEIIKVSFQCLLGLQHMNELDLVHRHLSPDNILIKKDGDIQLYNYGLYYMTEGGKNVSFPIGYCLIFFPVDLILMEYAYGISNNRFLLFAVLRNIPLPKYS